MPKKILVDLSVLKDSVTHRTVLQPKTIHLGKITQTFQVAVREPFPPRSDERFKLDQIPYIANLPKLVSAGHVELYRSVELVMEFMRNSPPDCGYLGLNVLEGLGFKSVRMPVERTIVFSGVGPSVGTTKEEQVQFLSSIQDEKFKRIHRAFNQHHIIDSFHFWTAEYNHLDVFLTTDQKFMNVFKNQAESKLKSSVKVMSPKSLSELFGYGPTDIELLARDNPPFR